MSLNTSHTELSPSWGDVKWEREMCLSKNDVNGTTAAEVNELLWILKWAFSNHSFLVSLSE